MWYNLNMSKCIYALLCTYTSPLPYQNNLHLLTHHRHDHMYYWLNHHFHTLLLNAKPWPLLPKSLCTMILHTFIHIPIRSCLNSDRWSPSSQPFPMLDHPTQFPGTRLHIVNWTLITPTLFRQYCFLIIAMYPALIANVTGLVPHSTFPDL